MPLKPVEVLLIEDDIEQFFLIESSLSSQKDFPVTLHSASRLDVGLAQLSENGIDVILLDLELPDVEGVESFIRLHASAPSVPVVVIADSRHEKDALQAVQMGAEDFVMKGCVNTDQLVHAIASATYRRRVTSPPNLKESADIEEELRQSEQRFRGAFEYAAIGLALVAPDGRWIRVNRSLCEIVGYSEEELLATDFQSITHPDDLEQDLDYVRKMLAGEISHYHMEKRYIHKQGHVIWILLSVSLVRDSKGTPLYFVSQIQDATERKLAEAGLEYRIKFEKLITEISTDFINLAPREIDRGLDQALKKIGEFAGIDRSYIFQFLDSDTKVRNTHEWCREGITSHKERLQNLSADAFPWFRDRIKRHEIIHVPRVKDLEADAQAEKDEFEFEGIQSLICVPIVYGETLLGFLGFDSVRAEKKWTDDIIALLRLVGEMLAKAFEQKRTEEERRESEERFRTLVANIPGAIYRYKYKLETGWTMEFVSTVVKQITGYSAPEFIKEGSRLLRTIVFEDDKADVEATMRKSMVNGSRYDMNYRILHVDGSIHWVHDQGRGIFSEEGKLLCIDGALFDITAHKFAEEKLNHLAYYDGLTDLPNRMLFMDRLNQAILFARRHERLVALLFIDLDQFKRINDTLGHAVGDELLKAVAERLKHTLFETDTVTRLGGDEFTILLSSLSRTEDAIKVAEKIFAALNVPFNIQGFEFFMSCSIGITFYPNDGLDSESLLKNADTAMYRAKEQGRSGYQLYSRDLHAKVYERLEMENALRYALKRNELCLYYQPLLNVETGGIQGVEALLRWNHPTLGLVFPGEFIALAEETGMIVAIGDWVLQEACLAVKKLQREGFANIRVAVNLSARQFEQESLVRVIKTALRESGLPPSYLELELTEGIIMRNVNAAAKTLCSLNEMGLKLSIDDFGTGYSSFNYLKQFPIDTLKIDRSFVRDVGVGKDGDAITKAIISLAHNLNLEVVAEGVETEKQFNLLRFHGCDVLQGNFISEPAPIESVMDFLGRQFFTERVNPKKIVSATLK